MDDGLVSVIVPSLGAGALLGGFFYGGLWLTTASLPRSRQPMLLALGSFLFRMSVVAAAFSLLAGTSFFPLILTLIAFLGTRWWLIRLAYRS